MELWTSEHAMTLLPAIVAMIVVALLLRKWLGNRELRIRMIPFQILAAVLFLIEIGKQLVSLSNGYDLYHLPFHFCSLFIFALPIAAFYRGKHRRTVLGVTIALCAAVLMLMLIYPNLIYGAWDVQEFFMRYLSFHTVAFHNIVLFEFILAVALRLHEPEPQKEQKAVVVCMAVFSAVAAIMAQVFKTNYANMYTCNIPPLEAVRAAVANALGTVPAQILYVLIVSSLHISFTLLAYRVYITILRLTQPKEKPSAM
ncbi:MAG: YwaF family protein [Clostridia bacterium]|nr:YwaF family protein [Clostridia bacterium]